MSELSHAEIAEAAQLIRDNAAIRVHPLVDAFETLLLIDRSERDLRAWVAAQPVAVTPVVAWADRRKTDLRDRLAAHTDYPKEAA